MWDGGVTPVLEAWLVTRGDIKPKAGTNGLTNGMGAGVPEREQTHPLADAAHGEEPRIRLVFVNPNMTKATGRSRAALVMIGQ